MKRNDSWARYCECWRLWTHNVDRKSPTHTCEVKWESILTKDTKETNYQTYRQLSSPMAWKYLQVPPLRQYPSNGQFWPSRILVFSTGTEIYEKRFRYLIKNLELKKILFSEIEFFSINTFLRIYDFHRKIIEMEKKIRVCILAPKIEIEE